MADMFSIGMSTADVVEHMKLRGPRTLAASGGFYHQVKRDPQVAARIETNLEEMASEAKEILKGAITKAAHNIAARVEDGDYKASKDVLEFAKVLGENKTAGLHQHLHMDFGSWLTQGVEKRIEHTIPSNTVEATYETCVDDVDEAPIGERLSLTR